MSFKNSHLWKKMLLKLKLLEWVLTFCRVGMSCVFFFVPIIRRIWSSSRITFFLEGLVYFIHLPRSFLQWCFLHLDEYLCEFMEKKKRYMFACFLIFWVVVKNSLFESKYSIVFFTDFYGCLFHILERKIQST